MTETNPVPPAHAGKTVQELQSIAADAAASLPAPPKKQISRAARLHLVDQLSRWGGSGLALFAGVSIYIGIVIARPIPIRAAIWAALIFGALYLCRRYRKEFRRGDRIASRPFRWRAYYTSTLAAVSAAFGAGAFLLLPDGTSDRAAIETLSLMVIAAIGAAAFHSAHRPTAIAAGLPASLAIAGAAAATFGPSTLTLVVFVVEMAAAGAVLYAAGIVEKRATMRFPRTNFVRRDTLRAAAETGQTIAGRAAAS